MCSEAVQNEGEGCPKWGKATDTTDKTDWGEIQAPHMAYKSYRPHEKRYAGLVSKMRVMGVQNGKIWVLKC